MSAPFKYPVPTKDEEILALKRQILYAASVITKLQAKLDHLQNKK